MAPISMLILAVVLPPVLVAVIVYVAEAVTADGVPLIEPVAVFKAKPAGNAGDTA